MSDNGPWSCPFCGRQWSTPDRALNCHPQQYAADLQQALDQATATITGLQQQNEALADTLTSLQELATITLPAAVNDSAEDRAALRADIEALIGRVAALEPAPDATPPDD